MSPTERLVAFILELLSQAPVWVLGPVLFILLVVLAARLDPNR